MFALSSSFGQEWNIYLRSLFWLCFANLTGPRTWHKIWLSWCKRSRFALIKSLLFPLNNRQCLHLFNSELQNIFWPCSENKRTTRTVDGKTPDLHLFKVRFNFAFHFMEKHLIVFLLNKKQIYTYDHVTGPHTVLQAEDAWCMVTIFMFIFMLISSVHLLWLSG